MKMLSRVANCIFWMSRYVERAENVARFIEVNQNLNMDLPDAISQQWAPLINTSGDFELFKERYGETTGENVVRFLTFDREYPNSILSCLESARENARTVRESISSAMWEELNTFFLMVHDASKRQNASDPGYEFFAQIKRRAHLLLGITDVTMSHSEGWHFARLGRLIERADKTSRIVDVKYYLLLPNAQDIGTPMDIVQWSALLKSATALEMYRKQYGRILPTRVAKFLLLDRYFPRSVHFCLIHAENSLHAITGTMADSFTLRSEQLLGRMRSDMNFTGIDDVISIGMHEYIDGIQGKLNEVGAAVQEDFFAYKPERSPELV